MSSFISIDYDFFIPHGMFESEIFIPTINDTMSGMLVYDWQMDEGRHPDFTNALWITRAMNFKMWGLDIQAMTEPPLSVEEFAMEVSARMGDYTSPMSWRGDSHGWAGIIARDYAKIHGPMSVVNFDAHHDLSYCDGPLTQFQKTGRIGCDDWALIGLDQNWISDYIIVYPDWLGRKEWSKGISKRLKKFESHITVTTFSEWLKAGSEITDAEAMFFARSSAWVPPWCDEGFQRLHEEFGYSECIDCTLGQSNSPYDTCKPREWDWATVEKEFQRRQADYDRLKGMASIKMKAS